MLLCPKPSCEVHLSPQVDNYKRKQLFQQGAYPRRTISEWSLSSVHRPSFDKDTYHIGLGHTLRISLCALCQDSGSKQSNTEILETRTSAYELSRGNKSCQRRPYCNSTLRMGRVGSRLERLSCEVTIPINLCGLKDLLFTTLNLSPALTSLIPHTILHSASPMNKDQLMKEH